MTTAFNVLTEIERIFLQVDELAHPNGFEIQPAFYGFSPGGPVVSYTYEMMMFVPTLKATGEGTACVRVDVNGLIRGTNAMSGYFDERGEFGFEDPRGDPIPGSTHVWNTLSPTERSWVDVMFTSGKVSPLEPVTRERFQSAKVRFFEAFESSVPRQTAYERWLADAPVRKAEREGLRKTLPAAQAATLVKTLEDAERDAGQSLKASEASERADSARQIALYGQMADRARADLAAMSPAERRTAAWIARSAEPTAPGVSKNPGDGAPLAPPDTSLAARVVVRRPEVVYQGVRSRVEPRLIQLHLSASLSCQAPVVQRAVVQAYRKLDWAAMNRLVNP